MIERLQEGVADAVAEMGRGAEQASVVEEMVESATVALSEIGAAVHEIDGGIHEVDAALRAQPERVHHAREMLTQCGAPADSGEPLFEQLQALADRLEELAAKAQAA